MAETSFSSRPLSVAFNVGLPSGVGVRAGYSPIPQLGVEVHAGTALLFQFYGADVVYRPLVLVGRNVDAAVPMFRAGASALQNNLFAFGGNAWLAVPSAAVGGELRIRKGFVLGADIGVSLPITPGDGAAIPSTVKLAPNFNLSIGYAFGSR